MIERYKYSKHSEYNPVNKYFDKETITIDTMQQQYCFPINLWIICLLQYE